MQLEINKWVNETHGTKHLHVHGLSSCLWFEDGWDNTGWTYLLDVAFAYRNKWRGK
jgi:hypothetical protein